jgi:hypothetical protein
MRRTGRSGYCWTQERGGDGADINSIGRGECHPSYHIILLEISEIAGISQDRATMVRCKLNFPLA